MLKFPEISAMCRDIPDDSRYFPSEVFKVLKKQKLLQTGLPWEARDKDFNMEVFTALYEMGKASLSVGRIFEGHINALKLIKDHGTIQQQQYYFEEARRGKIFSVWNTEMSVEALSAVKKKDGVVLKGAKTFCSGGLNIDHALVTAQMEAGKQLLVIPLKEYSGLQQDWSLWQPMGMKNSVSCRIDFSGIRLTSENLLGKTNVYEQEPWFSGGAMRFATVQLGGAAAVVDAAVNHLKELGRGEDPYQQQRLGSMRVQLESGKLWVARAQEINDHPGKYSAGEIVDFANMMRTAILEISEKILGLAERSVGVQGFMEGHPLERVYRDLRVYLKQPAPDLALQHVGRSVLKDLNE